MTRKDFMKFFCVLIANPIGFILDSNESGSGAACVGRLNVSNQLWRKVKKIKKRRSPNETKLLGAIHERLGELEKRWKENRERV